jgi:hypothetical protein
MCCPTSAPKTDAAAIARADYRPALPKKHVEATNFFAIVAAFNLIWRRSGMNGAGGTSGGIGKFLLGLVMMCGGFYMLLNGIVVSSHFGFGTRLFGFGPVGLTGGMILIPLIIGVAMVFYNAKNMLGWLIAIASLGALVFGVISSVSLNLRTMSAFELLVILTLAFGGLGLFLASLRPARSSTAQAR